MKDEILKPGELVELGKRLILVREELSLKQKQLAADLGISSSYLSDIEKGKSNPGFNFLMRLYRKYRVSLDWLLFCQKRCQANWIPGSFPGDFKVLDFLKFIFRMNRVSKSEKALILENEKIKHYVHKRIKQLKIHEQFELFYLILQLQKKKSYVYLIVDNSVFLPGSYSIRLKELFERLKEDAVVIYLTLPQVVGIESLNPGDCFVDGEVWFDVVKKIKNESEVREKIEAKKEQKK